MNDLTPLKLKNPRNWFAAGDEVRKAITMLTDGAFKIEFFAKPDPQVSAKDEVFFNFAVHVDVTDTAGETRSADRAINIGYIALQVALTADDWQTTDKAVDLKVQITLNKSNVNGFARLQMELPAGITAVNGYSANADFTFKEQKVRLIWL